jgi:hypothetical protein
MALLYHWGPKRRFPARAVKKSYSKAAEMAALKNTHGTSTMNRITRLGLGSIFYYSAITSYARMTSGASYWPQPTASAAALIQQGDISPG